MKIVMDTVSKQTLCPPEFFDYVRKINEAAELTGGDTKVTSESYLNKIIKDCSKTIVNKSDLKKRTRTTKKKMI